MIDNQLKNIKSPCVVISQPMYFPWVGMLEQIKLCNIFVHYDDVQFARGFFNRVQVKTSSGIKWMTVPLLNLHRGQLINMVQLDRDSNWKKSHLSLLRESYSKAPYVKDVIELVDDVFTGSYESLAQLSIKSTMSLVDYFEFGNQRRFYTSSEMHIGGSSTQRLLDICVELEAGTYLTGHGARNYLEHEKFEAKNIEVNYINYGAHPYAQLHGEFTPYVTSLDLIAHCGKSGAKLIAGSPISWREFLKEL